MHVYYKDKLTLDVDFDILFFSDTISKVHAILSSLKSRDSLSSIRGQSILAGNSRFR